VSATPTGPLHVGHGRQAAYGATLANLLNATGFSVSREYYINDAGRQMDILTVSTWLRYLEQGGENIPFPSNGYRGDYVFPIAAQLRAKVGGELHRPAAAVLANLPQDAPAGDKEAYIDAVIERARELIGVDGLRRVLELALERMLADIRDDLEQFGVSFDRWYSERALGDSGAIDRALERLKAQHRLYEKDGATWFRATEFGDEKDRVVVRENGVKTYFASDIAYHLEKRERGFERLIDVLGADHHGYVARVRAGLEAMGEPGDSLEVNLIQFVSLFRGGEKIPMGKREAQFVTLRELREEVGNDACRFFYLMRSHDQPLDFDLELAKSRTNENPVYYIQYAHARVSSVLKQLDARGFELDLEEGLANTALLAGEHEQAVLSSLTRYPEALELAATNRAPHVLVHYLRELANAFHTYYNAEQFIVTDPKLRNARLALVAAVQQAIRNGLTLLGVSSPETM
jgi:arginyl-tRNA synthetase